MSDEYLDGIMNRKPPSEPLPADPPPPDDALLRDLDAALVKPTGKGNPPHWAPIELVRRCRGRIAADAKDHARLIAELLRQEDRIDAAEARAQGMEAMLREFLGSGVEHTTRKYAVMQVLHELIAEANAALARPEPEGK